MKRVEIILDGENWYLITDKKVFTYESYISEGLPYSIIEQLEDIFDLKEEKDE